MVTPRRALPPSRANKKQIAAHLGPALVEKMKAFCKKKELSQTEIIAMSVNATAASYGMGPLLQVSRERLLYRRRSPAQIRTDGPACRKGTKRVAAYFKAAEVERVRGFAYEKGINQEEMIEEGMKIILAEGPQSPEIPADHGQDAPSLR
jgi:hypothetical protein